MYIHKNDIHLFLQFVIYVCIEIVRKVIGFIPGITQKKLAFLSLSLSLSLFYPTSLFIFSVLARENDDKTIDQLEYMVLHFQ